MHHFADDTNFLNVNSCVNFINKQVKYDLKNLANWLSYGKTELVPFTSSKKKLDFDLKIKLNGERLYEIESFRYLGNQIDKN